MLFPRMPLIECVPNLSEGRNQAVVDVLAAAVATVTGVHLLDRSSDPSHHRSVLTFVGEPPDVERAVVELATQALRTIDLRTHVGVHPRIGALDVVPLVPLRGATMADCVTLARSTAARLASTCDVPVFLYQHAASAPARQRLEHIRAGGLDGLAQRMLGDRWRPDYGPAALHPTGGATVVGARGFLIAWNLNLETSDLGVARAIARDVRESTGGLPAVKALGVALAHRGLAQVSMNLTDYQTTPMHVVFARVAESARRLGTRIAESEIIGLVPHAALAAARPHVTELWRWHADRVLEERLAALGL